MVDWSARASLLPDLPERWPVLLGSCSTVAATEGIAMKTANATAERDPRVDPRPGDVVKRDGDLRAFKVLEVTDQGISGRFGNGIRGLSASGTCAR